MDNSSPQPTEHIRYRSPMMIYGVVIGLLMCGAGLFLLISIILSRIEDEPFAALFLIAFIGMAALMVFTNVTAVETGSAGMKVAYLLKSRFIPWQEITDMSIRYGNPKWCEIKYSKLPIRRVTFFLDYSWRRQLSKSNLLLNSIINNADLKLVDQNFWGLPIYQREETSYE